MFVNIQIFKWLSLELREKLSAHAQNHPTKNICMASSGRSAAEMLAAMSQGLKTQTDAVGTGSQYSPKDIPADWDPNVGQYIPCPKNLKPVQGIFSYLRQMAGGQNPQDAGLVKCSCSSVSGPEGTTKGIFEWNGDTVSGWFAGHGVKGSWLILDFLDKRVIVDGYAVEGWGERVTIDGWIFSGGNDSPDGYSWTPLHSPEDRFPLRRKTGPVYFDTASTKEMFRYLRVSSIISDSNRNSYMPPFEVFGALVILKDPPKDKPAPETHT